MEPDSTPRDLSLPSDGLEPTEAGTVYREQNQELSRTHIQDLYRDPPTWSPSRRTPETLFHVPWTRWRDFLLEVQSNLGSFFACFVTFWLLPPEHQYPMLSALAALFLSSMHFRGSYNRALIERLSDRLESVQSQLDNHQND